MGAVDWYLKVELHLLCKMLYIKRFFSEVAALFSFSLLLYVMVKSSESRIRNAWFLIAELLKIIENKLYSVYANVMYQLFAVVR